MKRSTLVKVGISFAALSLGVGCGMTDMPSKMDQTNTTMDKMKAGMDQSNTLQGNLLNGMTTSNTTQTQLLGGIGTSNNTQASLLTSVNATNTAISLMSTKMDATNAGLAAMQAAMATTNEGVRQQKLAVCLANLSSAAATADMNPLPMNMIPWGQQVAQTMHEDEFVGYMSVWDNDVEEVMPAGNPPYSAAAIADAEPRKLIAMWSFLIVAGTAPQPLIQQMIQTEIMQGGQNYDLVPKIMAARFSFISNVLVATMEQNSQTQFNNPGKVQAGATFAQELDYIVQQQATLATTFQFTTSNMLIASDNAMFPYTVDPTQPPALWAALNTAITSGLLPQYKGLLTGTTTDALSLQALQKTVVAGLSADTPAAPTAPAPATPTAPPANKTLAKLAAAPVK